ncbi:unnamed protein product, partial [Staurois parvus]
MKKDDLFAKCNNRNKEKCAYFFNIFVFWFFNLYGKKKIKNPVVI